MNPWDKIFDHQFSAAMEIADKNYRENGDVFDLRARAICHLLITNYKDALQDYQTILEEEKKAGSTSDDTYMDIGLCYYALVESCQ